MSIRLPLGTDSVITSRLQEATHGEVNADGQTSHLTARLLDCVHQHQGTALVVEVGIEIATPVEGAFNWRAIAPACPTPPDNLQLVRDLRTTNRLTARLEREFVRTQVRSAPERSTEAPAGVVAFMPQRSDVDAFQGALRFLQR
jgi:hypothetical protein